MVRVQLDDGAVVELSRRAAEDIYDLMWMLAPERGAVTAAAKLHRSLRNALLREEIILDLDESTVFAKAQARIG